MAFEINANEDEGDVLTEGQQIKLKTVGRPVNQREIDEHQITHIPYRSWCKHCISGRGQSAQHRQLQCRDHEIPTISIDYAYLGEDGREDQKLQPMIVTKDDHSGTIRAHLVEEKGVNAYAIKRVGQDLGLLGYKK